MNATRIEVINKLGLHARAAAKVVTLAKEFESDIMLGSDGKFVDAKSIMSLLMLAAAKGTTLDAKAQGPDADNALDQLKLLFADRFGEDE